MGAIFIISFLIGARDAAGLPTKGIGMGQNLDPLANAGNRG
jgi:hypothetical protein